MYLENRRLIIDKVEFTTKYVTYNHELCALTICAELDNVVEYVIQRAQLIDLNIKGETVKFTIFCDNFELR